MHDKVYIPDAFNDHIRPLIPDDQFDDFIRACKRPLRKSIRVNTLKISVEEFNLIAQRNKWSLEPIPWCKEGFWIEADESTTPLGNCPEHMTGQFYIQEASSMLPVEALAPEKSCRVLDMAAAPGSKTTQLAALMDNQGVLVANEFSSSRVKVLHANIERCGVQNTALTNYDGNVFGGWLSESFDYVLLDAPCSGEGTLRKDENAMKNWSLESVNAIAEKQKELIESAFQALVVGGTMVYSTCTLSLEENQQVLHFLKDKFSDAVEFVSIADLFPGADKSLTDEGFLHVFPHTYDSEGFFIAKLRKLAPVETPVVNKKLGKFPFEKASKKQNQQLQEALTKSLKLDIPVSYQLWFRDKDVWLFPTMLEPFLTEMRFSRMGIKIAEVHKNGYRWQHQVATCLASDQLKLNQNANMVDLDREQARDWFMGRDIRPEATSKGEVIVSHQGAVIGLGKWVGNRIKNGLPRELVRDKNLF